jgi:hypothetical protein
LGGKVTTQKTPVPGMGYFAVCTDTESNTFGIFEADETAKSRITSLFLDYNQSSMNYCRKSLLLNLVSSNELA